MSAGITTVRRGVLRSGIVPVALVLLAAGLGTVVPAQASARTPTAGSPRLSNSPGAGTAYVLNYNSDTVTPITIATNTPGTPIPVESAPYNPALMTITPDRKTVYVLDSRGVDGGDLIPIAAATSTPGTPIAIDDPAAIAFTPDSKTAYVVFDPYRSSSAPPGPGYVLPVTTATNTPGTAIQVGDGAGQIVITPDGKTAYVLNGQSDTVTPIATATNTAGTPIPVGEGPSTIVIAPATVSQGPAFTSGSAGTAAFGVPFTFTVTTSGEPAPTITRAGRMPSGLHFTRTGNGTATISGTPANGAAGIYPLTLTASNKHGTVTQSFTLTVTRAPSIKKKIHTIWARVGIPRTRTFRALGYPAPAWTESGSLRAMLETCGSAGKGASAKEVYLPGDRVVEVSSNGRRWNAGPGRYTHAHSSA